MISYFNIVFPRKVSVFVVLITSESRLTLFDWLLSNTSRNEVCSRGAVGSFRSLVFSRLPFRSVFRFTLTWKFSESLFWTSHLENLRFSCKKKWRADLSLLSANSVLQFPSDFLFSTTRTWVHTCYLIEVARYGSFQAPSRDLWLFSGMKRSERRSRPTCIKRASFASLLS